MRINVYSQELTGEVELFSQETRDGKHVYHGVRMYFASPESLHNTPDDDDRSAITFWIPKATAFGKLDLAQVFMAMAEIARTAPE